VAYKLIEITFDEHVALHESGVWVQWEPLRVDGTWWYKSTAAILKEEPARAWNFARETKAKYYTRVELSANDQPE
jgi:hypothetical protein